MIDTPLEERGQKLRLTREAGKDFRTEEMSMWPGNFPYLDVRQGSEKTATHPCSP